MHPTLPLPALSDRPNTRRRLLTALATLLVAVLALSGCAAGNSADEPASESSPGASSSTTEAAVKVPKAPRNGACYRLDVRDAAKSASTADPVPCTKPHTTKTIHVGRLGAEGKVAPDFRNASVRDRLTATCNREAHAFLGGDLADRRLSRLQVVWFAPTQQELAEGARWMRCDVLALGRSDSLMTLPRLKMQGVLDRAAGADTFGLCGTASPGTRGFERVACGLRHSWAAISTIPISDAKRYPGVAKVRAAGDQACSDQVNARTSELKFAYGWEWPTLAQWKAGQRFGYCWAPASLA